MVPSGWRGGLTKSGYYSYLMLKEGCTSFDAEGCTREFRFGPRDVITFYSQTQTDEGCDVRLMQGPTSMKIGGLSATERNYFVNCRGAGSTSWEYQVPAASSYRFFLTGGSESFMPATVQKFLTNLKWG